MTKKRKRKREKEERYIKRLKEGEKVIRERNPKSGRSLERKKRKSKRERNRHGSK